MTVLRVEAVSKRFGGVRAVAEVSFAVERNQVFAVIGPNGAGKTSLFNIVCGISRPDSGRVFLQDRDVTDRRPHQLAAAGVARTFQTPQVFPAMSVLENVLVGQHLQCDARLLPAALRLPSLARAEREHRSRAHAVLERLGIASEPHAPAASLPYGVLKRLEIARALASRPAVLLLDEPAAGLNHSEAKEIDELVTALAGDGMAVVLIEHNMRLVMGVSDRILVLDAGRKLAEGTAADVQRNPDVIAAYLGAGAATSASAKSSSADA